MRSSPGTVQHIVLFKFPRALTPEEEKEMTDQVRAWPEKIGGMTDIRFGADLTGARSRGYQYLLVEQFADEAGLSAYATHPGHVAFADWVHGLGCEELAFDYVLGADTVILDAG